MHHIGIDPGKNTGIAVWNKPAKSFDLIKTTLIHQAMDIVLQYHNAGPVTVIVEDARLRKWFGANAADKQQGAGSVKRDATIWEDFLTDKSIPFQMRHPVKGLTKMDKVLFTRMTGWKGVTTEHSRDAGMLVFAK